MTTDERIRLENKRNGVENYADGYKRSKKVPFARMTSVLRKVDNELAKKREEDKIYKESKKTTETN